MTERFTFSPAHPVLRVLFAVLLMGSERAYAEVGRDALRIRFGLGFAATVPLSSVIRAEPDGGPVFGWGVHGFAGRWLVNTSSRGMVVLTIDPPARGWVLGFPVRLRRLRLSLAEPERFVAVLARRG